MRRCDRGRANIMAACLTLLMATGCSDGPAGEEPLGPEEPSVTLEPLTGSLLTVALLGDDNFIAPLMTRALGASRAGQLASALFGMVENPSTDGFSRAADALGRARSYLTTEESFGAGIQRTDDAADFEAEIIKEALLFVLDDAFAQVLAASDSTGT